MKNKEKEKYRTYILAIKPYINYPALYKKTGVSSSNLASFLSGNDAAIGLRTLERIKGVSEGMIEKINMADTQFER